LILSGIDEIVDPGKAVNLIFKFKILPDFFIIIIISILPVIEILIGGFLISGMYLKLILISAFVFFSVSVCEYLWYSYWLMFRLWFFGRRIKKQNRMEDGCKGFIVYTYG